MSTQTADTDGSTTGRTRDPARKEKILDAAVVLIAERGYHAVSLADIGSAAGIVGSGIYRHFDSKAAILVELFERVIDHLLSDQEAIIDAEEDLRVAFQRLIAGQVEFVVGDREVARVYHHEISNLPDSDQRRLRRKQRLYLEGWVHLLQELRGDLDEGMARTLVHAAIGAIQSALFHNVGLPDDRMRTALADAASSVLRTNTE